MDRRSYDVSVDRRFRRNAGDILGDELGQAGVDIGMDHHEAIDAQILVHRQRHRWPPLAPARRPELARVERRAEKTDGDERFHDRPACSALARR